MKFFLTFFVLSFLTLEGYCQTADTSSVSVYYNNKKDFSLLAGYQQGKYGFAEIGFAINQYGTNRHPFSFDYFVSNEIKLDKKTIIGPKVGVWVGGGAAMGLNFIYYTDFSKNCFVFRPEFGIGIQKLKLVYGYNWNWTKTFYGINQHLAGLTYCFTLKRLKSTEGR